MSACSCNIDNAQVWANDKCPRCFMLFLWSQLTVVKQDIGDPISLPLYRNLAVSLAYDLEERKDFIQTIEVELKKDLTDAERDDYFNDKRNKTADRGMQNAIFASPAKCAYSGKVTQKLEVDHFLSKSQYPRFRHDASNLFLCDKGLNRLKQELSPNQFISEVESLLLGLAEQNRATVDPMVTRLRKNMVAAAGKWYGESITKMLNEGGDKRDYICRCLRTDGDMLQKGFIIPRFLNYEGICMDCGEVLAAQQYVY